MSYIRLVSSIRLARNQKKNHKNQKNELGFGYIKLSPEQDAAEKKDLEFFQRHPNSYWYVRSTNKKELYNLPFNRSRYLMVFFLRPSENMPKEIFRLPIADRNATPASLGLPVQRNNIPIDEQQLYLTLLASERYIWSSKFMQRQTKQQKRIRELINLHKLV